MHRYTNCLLLYDSVPNWNAWNRCLCCLTYNKRKPNDNWINSILQSYNMQEPELVSPLAANETCPLLSSLDTKLASLSCSLFCTMTLEDPSKDEGSVSMSISSLVIVFPSNRIMHVAENVITIAMINWLSKVFAICTIIFI